MYPPVVTKDPTAVEAEVQAIYLSMFPAGDPLFVPRVFGWAIECFTGRYRNYQAVDARYHDFEHTLQGTLCMMRLLRGRHHAGAQPSMTQRMFQLGLLAILLHDTGYLKLREDMQGTGAKYTIVHVGRSAEFAGQLMAEKGFSAADIRSVQNMIRCTGVNANLAALPFQSELEKLAGFALASADLLGQMAADDYLEKLPILFAEFAEAARFSGDKTHFVASFSSAEDLVEKTPAFWEGFVLQKLNRDFAGSHRFLNDPYPSGPNYYLHRVEANLNRLKQRLAMRTAPVA
ncbi:MAG TPA: hypothetical protein VN578_03050 [Candidatus Binatia bacterium]|jgi:hypothetical protein|nr:hypothetical protein [Candidatus Binatia bacterium]